ncbi:MAG: Imm44 family immunity protein [bacterium]
MKLWIGGEIQADVADAFREARSFVERTVNKKIESRHYDTAFDDWDVIAILRDDDAFEELTRLSKKKRDMDFRLRLGYREFKYGDANERRSMIFKMLCRSIELLATKVADRRGLESLLTDLIKIGQEHGWKAT